MRLTVSSVTTSQILTLDVPSDIQIAGLKECISADLSNNPPASTLSLYHNGVLLRDDTRTLEAAGMKDDDMIAVHAVQPQQPAQRQAGGRNAEEERRRAQRAQEGQDIERIRLQALGNPSMMDQLRQSDDNLARSVHDAAEFERAFRRFQQKKREVELARARELEELNNDPFNVESQRKIEELIRQEQVMENLQSALEHHPEVAFGRVHMLYIPVEVNGVPVKAFVDSGAQATIMSPDCAQRCSIMRLIDTRFEGIARGVGTAKILGRVHSAPIKIGNLHLPCSFTVMEGKDVDLLLGLDMLKRHQACIDLKTNRLVIQDESVEFLPESEIPKGFEERMRDEPTIEGPGGTQIGGVSGAVIEPPQAGSSASQPPPQPQPQPQQQQQQQAPQLPPRQQRPPLSEASISMLMDMGISREQAVAALEATNGDLDMAASLYFQ